MARFSINLSQAAPVAIRDFNNRSTYSTASTDTASESTTRIMVTERNLS